MLKFIQVMAVPLLLASCAASSTSPAPVSFGTALSSASEVPPVTVASGGSGNVTATLNGAVLSVSGSFKGLTGPATMAHLHGPADKATAAGVLAPLTLTGDTVSGNVTLTPDQITQLKSGLLYVNVHTAANPKGELRGQLGLQSATVPTSTSYTSSLSSANEVPAVSAASGGSGTVSAVLAGMTLTVSGSFKGLTGAATMAHLHGPAAKTAAGPLLFPLEFRNDVAGSGSLSGTVMLKDDQVTALRAGQLYINLHTAANTKGEIRGQLELPTAGY